MRALDVLAGIERAARSWASKAPVDRGAVLGRVADVLDGAADELAGLAEWECRLPAAVLRAELNLVTRRLRECGRGAGGGPEAATGPDVRRLLVPLGPVAVFPAAYPFSLIGADTVAALAAGCPVVVSPPQAHPELSDRAAKIISESLPPGVFTVVHGQSASRQLVLDRRIRAVSFTGCAQAGRELHALVASRPDPVPFHGSFASVNPVFVTGDGAAARGTEIVRGFVAAFTAAAGQQHAKPGLLVVPAAAGLVEEAAVLVRAHRAEPLFNGRDSVRYEENLARLCSSSLTVLVRGELSSAGHTPSLLHATLAEVRRRGHEVLSGQVGPVAVVATYESADELLALAEALPGQVSATVHGDLRDGVVPALLAALSGRADRIGWNEWPGAPHDPLGSRAVERFQRPVIVQGSLSRCWPGVPG